MSTPTPDYGEPWKTREGFDDDTIEVYAPNPRIEEPFQPCSLAVVESPLKGVSTKRLAKRIKDCCNALAGVQDPAETHLANLNATIEQQDETLKVMNDALKEAHRIFGNLSHSQVVQRLCPDFAEVAELVKKSHDPHA